MAEHGGGAEGDGESAPAASAVVDVGLSAALLAAGKRRKATSDPRLDAVLEKQALMLDAQLEHMHEQRELQLSRLRWGRFSDQMRAALQAMTAAAGIAAALVVAGAVWKALHSDRVMVDAFHAPPTLAAQGLDGAVVASGVMDELIRLQAATRSARAKRDVKDAWSNDIRLELPETGVSVGEIQRYLDALLGRDTHISGDIVQTTQGLTLTVRGTGVPGRSFTGPDLSALSTQAAEYIYGAAEPAELSSYLVSHGRYAEAIAFSKSAFPAAKAADRAWILNHLGNAYGQIGNPRVGLLTHEQAIRLKPDLWAGWANVVDDLWTAGDEQGALQATERFERLSGRGGAGNKVSPWYYENGDFLRNDWSALRAEELANATLNNGAGAQVSQAAPILALADTMLHDPQQAHDDLTLAVEADKDAVTIAISHFTRGWDALDRGDWNLAAAEMEPVGVAFADPALRGEFPGLNCWLAPAEEMAGHPDRADAALGPGGHFVDCYRFRADILDHRGDWPGAQAAYAAAVALAPDLPAAWFAWGQALARHGDLAGAMAKFALANQKGPHWADPLKAWGDSLAAQHRLMEAEAKYAAAARYAPRWAALRIAWGRALQADGRFREAIDQYRVVGRQLLQRTR